MSVYHGNVHWLIWQTSCQLQSANRDYGKEGGDNDRSSFRASRLGQFHQHLTHSFYGHRSQKRKKYSQAVSLFDLI